MKIIIKSRVSCDGQTDITEIETRGEYYLKNGAQYIMYKESSEGLENISTMIKIKDSMVTIKRYGKMSSNICVKEGRSYNILYDTGSGTIEMNITGQAVKYELNEEGGFVKLKYEIAMEGTDIKNIIEMTIEVGGNNE